MEYDITGPQGNTWSLMGNAERWAKQLQWSRQEIDAMLEDMQSGDYEHVLDVIEEKFPAVTLIGREEEDDA